MVDETDTIYCTCTPVVETEFGDGNDQSPLLAIVEAVASVEGVSPEELDSLYETIDLDLVDRLLANHSDTSSSPICLQFSVRKWNVFVRSDGAIRVCDSNVPTDTAPAFQKSLSD